MVELVVAAVDKQQRVRTARDAVDKDLGRSVGSQESVANLEVAVELAVVGVEQLHREVGRIRRVGCAGRQEAEMIQVSEQSRQKSGSACDSDAPFQFYG